MNKIISNDSQLTKLGRAITYRLPVYMDASDKIERCVQDLLDPGSAEDDRAFSDIIGITREEFIGLVEGGLFNRETLDNKISVFADREARCSQLDRPLRERLDFLIKYYSSIGSFSSKIMTPGSVIEKMINMIPQDVLLNKNTTFFDPACGRGTFLCYLFVQLMEELADEIADENERAHSIIERISGCDISKFQIRIAKSMLMKLVRPYGIDRRELFLNCQDFLKDELNMKFDVILGNPPYHEMDQDENSTNANKASASTIYQKFHFKALKELEAKHVLFVIPGKCLAGGKGLTEFRDDLKSGHVKQIIFNENATAKWFDGHGPREGHIIYHYDSEYDGLVQFTNEITGLTHKIDTKKYDILLRDPRAESIVDKVLAHGKFIHNYGSKPFGMRTNHFDLKEREEPSENEEVIQCAFNSGNNGKLAFKPVRLDEVTKNKELIGKFKVITSEVGGGGKDRQSGSDGTSNIFILKSGQVCTESYLLLKVFDDLKEAENFKGFMHSAFAQYIVYVRKPTHHIVNALGWIPELDWSQQWTDQSIYEFFRLNSDEIKVIESEMANTIRKHRKYQLNNV